MRGLHVRGEARRRAPLVVGVLAAVLGGCASTTFDLGNLEQPVTMSRSAIVGRTGASPHEAGADAYAATAAFENLAAAYGSKVTVVNDGQAAAFGQIGGDPRRAITGVRLHVETTGAYLVLHAQFRCVITAQGKVVQLEDGGAGHE